MADWNENVFNEWRTADRQAHLLEQALSLASLNALQGKGPAPAAQDRERARKLRQSADDLFQHAMAELAARAANNRR